ncbi:unnamed protein product [Sorangium cellulosum So ce56]|uniref:Sorangium cellulosum 'So ce 56' complete genome n=1 Tax=Sorangium cellulosum (strain So ce56) TaxID=448385 RepID=A9GIX9_SORC5|nr:unnamed protein product [Sorangium cellulosum So ce56]
MSRRPRRPGRVRGRERLTRTGSAVDIALVACDMGRGRDIVCLSGVRAWEAPVWGDIVADGYCGTGVEGTASAEPRAKLQTERSRVTRRKQILIVDDDQEIREMLEITLEEEGYDVLSASDGEAALALLERNRPNLILLDMRMPVMDGWGFARAYASCPGPRAPILVMTAAVDAGTWAREVGACASVAKPFDLNRLLDSIAAHAGCPSGPSPASA